MKAKTKKVVLASGVAAGAGVALGLWLTSRKARAATIPKGEVEVVESAYVEADGQCFFVGDGSGRVVDMAFCQSIPTGTQSWLDRLVSWLR